MATVQIPPLKIQGIKTKAIPHIKDCLNWNMAGIWIEPFLGSAVVPLNIRPERALLGDSNPHIVRFYQSIQNKSVTSDSVREFLEREGKLLLNNEDSHYYLIRERFNEYHDSHDFLFINRACFNGLMRFSKKGKFNTPFCRKPDRFRPAYITKICNQIQQASNCMDGKSWDFVTGDWKVLLGKATEDDFVYCDPPYIGRHTDYFNSWADQDAQFLEARLKQLPCPFLYSMWSENKYRRNDRLYSEFSDYRIKEFSHFYHLGSTESLRNKMTEALVIG